MRQLGSNPDDWFTFDDLLNQMKAVGKYGVLLAPALLQIMVSDPKNITNMDDAAQDINKLRDFATFNEETANLFKERINDVIQDAVRLGWI